MRRLGDNAMNALYSYTMLVAALAVLCALFECLIPQGKLKQVVLLAVGLLFLIGIVTPLAELLGGKDLNAFPSTPIAAPVLPQTAPPTHEELLRGYLEDSLAE